MNLEGLAARREQLLHLAKLSPIEYDIQRKDAAEEIGCKVTALDVEVKQLRKQQNPNGEGDAAVEELEPWDSPVSGRELFDQVRSLLNTYMDLPQGADTALVLWVFGSYAYDQFNLFPKLLISSPMPECGKSTLMEIVEAVCRSALLVSNASASTIFRSVELWHPTLLLDEIDAWMRYDNEEMRGLVNAGHTRRGAFVLRSIGDDHTPTKFSVWGPMALAGIKKPAETIVGRSIQVELQRMAPGTRKDKLPLTLFEDCQVLRRQLLRWEQDTNLRLIDDPTPAIGGHRQRDNWSVLIRIASSIDTECVKEARAVFEKVVARSVKGDDLTLVPQLLEDIRAYIEETNAGTGIHSGPLVEWLEKLEDRPWSDWKGGLTQTKLAKQLEGLAKPRTIDIVGRSLKGYRTKQLEAAFRRYLPADTPTGAVGPSEIPDSLGYGRNEGVRNGRHPTARNSLQPSKNAEPDDLTLPDGGLDDEGWSDD